MVRSTHFLAVALALTCLPLAFVASATAQSKKNAEFIPGTVVSIEKEKTGTNYKMKFKSTADDEELDVKIGPRTQLLVTVKGDAGFLKPNVFVQTRVVLTNNEYYAKDFTVILGGAPAAYVKPDAADKTVFDIAGKVTMTDAMGIMVQCGPQPRKVSFEAEKNVTVKIAYPMLIKEGDAAEVEGTIIKSKKTLNAMAVNVTSAEALNSDEYFASLEERKKSKTSKAKTTTSKGKSKEGDAGGDADPFGVLKKKGATKKDEKTDSADAKKDTEKKDTEKKDAEKKDTEKKDDAAAKKEAEKTDKS